MVAGVVAAMLATPALADKHFLLGTLRDFQDSHPDFEHSDTGTFSTIRGMVKSQLGPDGRPILNVNRGGCIEVFVKSHDKEISNVVLRLAHADDAVGEDVDFSAIDDDVHYKYDGVSGHEGYFAVPEEYADHRIIGLWVKAGPNDSGDGPGYGEEIEGEYVEYEDVGPVPSGSEDFSVTFYAEAEVPPHWLILSEASFNQWWRDIASANMTTMKLLEMDNGMDRPGGTYVFDRSRLGDGPFAPLDGELFGEDDPHSRNHHFTLSVKAHFTYDQDEPMQLRFMAQDDLWVFVNEQLVVDLGGVKSDEGYEMVDLHGLASELGLTHGEPAVFHLFFADRQSPAAYLLFEATFPFNGEPGD